jgi:hypothetical protein
MVAIAWRGLAGIFMSGGFLIDVVRSGDFLRGWLAYWQQKGDTATPHSRSIVKTSFDSMIIREDGVNSSFMMSKDLLDQHGRLVEH